MRTLYLDIETAPAVAYVWGLYNQNIGLNQIVQPGRVICMAWSWGRGDMSFSAEWDRGGQARMVGRLHEALDEADVVVHYNGQSFDVPHLYREFIEAGYGPPAPFQQVDLYRAVRSKFKFQSNKLAWVSEALDLESGGKLSTDMSLWTRVLDGDKAARAEMQAYNEQDVVLLIDMHERLLPWIDKHPNVSLYTDGTGCVACGSSELERRGFSYTGVSKFQRYQCRACGKWQRSGSRINGAENRGIV